MTRAITIIALTCFLVVGAAATSILGRDSVPAAPAGAGFARTCRARSRTAKARTTGWRSPTLALAAGRAAASGRGPERAAAAGLCLRQPADVDAPKIDAPPPRRAAAPPKPKAAGKPPPQKSYALLSDVQIAGIKERLKLSPSQESYWPAVENALRAVARKIHATRQADPNATGAPIDPEADEVQQLKSAAMPLLFQLREDQKREVRTLARIIGLEKVASQI